MSSNKPAGLRALLATLIVATTLMPGLALAASPDVPTEFPIRDFFSNPEKAYFRLSEDGKTLGFMQPVEIDGNPRRLNVFVQALDGSKPVGEPRRLTGETARDIGIYYWKGSNTILYEKDFGGDENTHVVAVDVESGKITDLTPGTKVRAGIQDALPDDPGHILVIHNRRDPTVFDVYRIELKTGKETIVATNPGDIIGWQTDHDGRLRMALRSDGLNSILLYRDDEKAEFEPIITTDYKTDVFPAFFTADNRKFYAISNRGRDKTALVLIDPANPDVEEVLYVHPDVDLSGANWSRARKTLTHADYVTAKAERRYFDDETRTLFERLEKKLPGMQVYLQGNNKAEDKFIVAAANDRTEGARYIYDAKADTLSKLADLNPKLPEAAMAPVKPIRYQSRDGLTINGYLTLPVGVKPKDLACIVNPHGGPWARDVWGYNAEIQFLANRGYCILQVNFRGSTGYGREFWEASFGQWGLKMQDDITDGVEWLIAEGIADPKRIGIYGGSYGGYATLAGVVYTPDLYAAAVDYVGVSNLLTFMNTIPPYWEPLRPKFEAMVGDPVKDIERLKATSPALHADRIKTPLFIAQGANDPRVNKAESDQMVEALRKRGVEVQYMVKDNEGHGFRNEENQYEFYGAMEAFFAKHLKPRATAESATK
jgi:dipeptidyl aminopeptidase/acylaminoacyl peptidase